MMKQIIIAIVIATTVVSVGLAQEFSYPKRKNVDTISVFYEREKDATYWQSSRILMQVDDKGGEESFVEMSLRVFEKGNHMEQPRPNSHPENVAILLRYTSYRFGLCHKVSTVTLLYDDTEEGIYDRYGIDKRTKKPKKELTYLATLMYEEKFKVENFEGTGKMQVVGMIIPFEDIQMVATYKQIGFDFAKRGCEMVVPSYNNNKYISESIKRFFDHISNRQSLVVKQLRD